MARKIFLSAFLVIFLAGCSGSPYYIYSRAPIGCLANCAKSPFRGDLREPVGCLFIAPSCAAFGAITLTVDTVLVPVIFFQEVSAGDDLDEIDQYETESETTESSDSVTP